MRKNKMFLSCYVVLKKVPFCTAQNDLNASKSDNTLEKIYKAEPNYETAIKYTVII